MNVNRRMVFDAMCRLVISYFFPGGYSLNSRESFFYNKMSTTVFFPQDDFMIECFEFMILSAIDFRDYCKFCRSRWH